jgi:hypothetical protein
MLHILPQQVEAKGVANKCALFAPLCLLFLEFFCRLVLDVPLGNGYWKNVLIDEYYKSL